jgi:hypothetical protein
LRIRILITEVGRMIRRMGKGFIGFLLGSVMMVNGKKIASMVKVHPSIILGTIFYSEGEAYEGEWKYDKPEGIGNY